MTVPSASRTGNALTRNSRSLAAISLNDEVLLTEIGCVDMTSLTTAVIIVSSPADKNEPSAISPVSSAPQSRPGAGRAGRAVGPAQAGWRSPNRLPR